MEYQLNDITKDFIRDNQKFLVTGHKNPDGDCAGAQIALTHFLNRIGKQAVAFSHGPFNRLEIAHLKEDFVSDLKQITELAGYAVIILDASSTDRIGEIADSIKSSQTLVIDHHRGEPNFGGLVFLNPEAPSTTYLVLQLIESLGYTPDTDEADHLLLGLCTDTGFFRHIEIKAPEIFQAVSRLTAAGASIKKAFRQMYGGASLNERKMLGAILTRTESHFNERLLFTYFTIKERRAIDPVALKTEEIYRLLQLVKDIEILVFMKQEEPERYSVSFRSNGSINVDTLAAQLGGGGHRLAAGCEINGTFNDIKEKVFNILKTCF